MSAADGVARELPDPACRGRPGSSAQRRGISRDEPVSGTGGSPWGTAAGVAGLQVRAGPGTGKVQQR
jgi:hypothetical protein